MSEPTKISDEARAAAVENYGPVASAYGSLAVIALTREKGGKE